jgi:hypothetical protein
VNIAESIILGNIMLRKKRKVIPRPKVLRGANRDSVREIPANVAGWVCEWEGSSRLLQRKGRLGHCPVGGWRCWWELDAATGFDELYVPQYEAGFVTLCVKLAQFGRRKFLWGNLHSIIFDKQCSIFDETCRMKCIFDKQCKMKCIFDRVLI